VTPLSQAKTPEGFISLEDHQRALEAAIVKAYSQGYGRAILNVQNAVASVEGVENPNPLLAQSVEVLDLSVRAANILQRERVSSLGDLVRKREIDVGDFRNMGAKTLDEIKEKLASYGLRLGMTI
jgi:DNA-directed RNA polymerase alpha subunit